MRQDTRSLMPTRVAGTPCFVKVTHGLVVKGGSNDSDWDYTGYTEFEFELYDRSGYRAAWLEKKLTDEDNTRIESEYAAEIAEYTDYTDYC